MFRSSVIVVLALFVVGCGGGEGTTETTSADSSDTTVEATTVTTTPPDTSVTTNEPSTTVPATTTMPPTTTTAPVTTIAGSPPATTLAPVSSDGFCDNVNALLATNEEFVTRLMSGDTSHVEATLEQMPLLAAAARESAPPEMADAFDLIVTFIDLQVEAVKEVDLADGEAVADAMGLEMDEPTSNAFNDMFQYGGTECGYTSGMDLEAPEPPDCEILDAELAATTAGVTVDTSESKLGGSFSLPGFAIDGCGYGGGEMVLSTITYLDLEAIVEDYPASAVSNGGEIIEAELGSLPDTSVITSQNGTLTVTVFEADTPFAVGFAEDLVAPAKVVAAAEALLANQD